MKFLLLLEKIGLSPGKLLTGLCVLIRFFTRRKPSKGIVLIVEDDPNDTLLLERKLDSVGWRHRYAPDGKTASIMVADRFFDCALVDLRLPGMSGLEVVQAISEVSPRTRIAIMTGVKRFTLNSHFSHRVFSKDIPAEDLRKWLEKETL